MKKFATNLFKVNPNKPLAYDKDLLKSDKAKEVASILLNLGKSLNVGSREQFAICNENLDFTFFLEKRAYDSGDNERVVVMDNSFGLIARVSKIVNDIPLDNIAGGSILPRYFSFKSLVYYCFSHQSRGFMKKANNLWISKEKNDLSIQDGDPFSDKAKQVASIIIDLSKDIKLNTRYTLNICNYHQFYLCRRQLFNYKDGISIYSNDHIIVMIDPIELFFEPLSKMEIPNTNYCLDIRSSAWWNTIVNLVELSD